MKLGKSFLSLALVSILVGGVVLSGDSQLSADTLDTVMPVIVSVNGDELGTIYAKEDMELTVKVTDDVSLTEISYVSGASSDSIVPASNEGELVISTSDITSGIEGSYDITISATDGTNITEETITFILDTTAPIIDYNILTEQSSWGNYATSVFIEVTVIEDNLNYAATTLEGIASSFIEPLTDNGDGTYTGVIYEESKVAGGIVDYSFFAYDLAGNSSNISNYFEFDELPSVPEIVDESGISIITSEEFELSYSLYDADFIKYLVVTIDGEEVYVDGFTSVVDAVTTYDLLLDESYLTSDMLKDDEIVVEIYVEDTLGAYNELEFTYTYDISSGSATVEPEVNKDEVPEGYILYSDYGDAVAGEFTSQIYGITDGGVYTALLGLVWDLDGDTSFEHDVWGVFQIYDASTGELLCDSYNDNYTMFEGHADGGCSGSFSYIGEALSDGDYVLRFEAVTEFDEVTIRIIRFTIDSENATDAIEIATEGYITEAEYYDGTLEDLFGVVDTDTEDTDTENTDTEDTDTEDTDTYEESTDKGDDTSSEEVQTGDDTNIGVLLVLLVLSFGICVITSKKILFK